MFFELDDIRRRHSLYFDCYNAGVWVDAPEKYLKLLPIAHGDGTIPEVQFQVLLDLLLVKHGITFMLIGNYCNILYILV
jgi:hypothetical protein